MTFEQRTRPLVVWSLLLVSYALGWVSCLVATGR